MDTRDYPNLHLDERKVSLFVCLMVSNATFNNTSAVNNLRQVGGFLRVLRFLHQ
jgi:hypothetical protein